MFSRNKLMSAAVLLLLLFMMSIIWTNYASQVELRESSLHQFNEKTAKEADAFSHFFSERLNDIISLSASGEIEAYFENKALGMSKEYGLWASLVEISELFKRFVQGKTLGEIEIYKRIAFLDEMGEVLANNSNMSPEGRFSDIVVPLHSIDAAPTILFESGEEGADLILILPYRFEGQQVGTMLAWLNTEQILPYLMKHSRPTGRGGHKFFRHGQDIFSPLTKAPEKLMRQARGDQLPQVGDILESEYTLTPDLPTDCLVASAPIEHTPISLINIIPKQEVLGSMAPWESLLSTIILATLFIGGALIGLRMGARNLILKVQITEAAKQASEIKVKNLQLEEEINARRTLEDALRQANDELELRVAKRTKALTREVKERRDAESLLRLIFNNTHDAIFLYDTDGSLLDVNETTVELYRIDRQALLELQTPQGISGAGSDFDQYARYWEQARDGEEVLFEWVAKSPTDGTEFDVEVALNMVELGSQSVILANVHDISEQKRRLSQQEEHQAFLTTVFEGIGAAIFVFDPEAGVMINCNSVGETLLDLPKTDILETSCRKDVPFISNSTKDLLCLDANDEDCYEEGVLTLPDGTPRPVSRQIFGVNIGGKKHLVQVAFDITQRKDLERQLSIAQKLESIGMLAAGIAHEINTPIQYIGDSIRFVKEGFEDTASLLQFYDTVLNEHLDEAARAPIEKAVGEEMEDLDIEYVLEEAPKACDRAIEGVQRVASIVLAMKNFSHHGEEKPKATDINQALRDTITVSRNEWKFVAELETDLAPDLPLVQCMPGSINQVLLNIIVNAAHAIGGSVPDQVSGTIRASTAYTPPFVTIRIADTGCGISKENLGKVFDPFFTTKDVGKGTGQGLAIVHDIIVNKHGGMIDVESEVGQGTTFTIQLPAEKQPI